jgi:hypothetical protein
MCIDWLLLGNVWIYKFAFTIKWKINKSRCVDYGEQGKISMSSQWNIKIYCWKLQKINRKYYCKSCKETCWLRDTSFYAMDTIKRFRRPYWLDIVKSYCVDAPILYSTCCFEHYFVICAGMSLFRSAITFN